MGYAVGVGSWVGWIVDAVDFVVVECVGQQCRASNEASHRRLLAVEEPACRPEPTMAGGMELAFHRLGIDHAG